MVEAPGKVDLLIVGATLVTMDGERRILTDGGLAIRGDSIAGVGKRRDIETRFVADEKIEAGRFVVTPGFVNGHIHITGEQILRGYVPDNLDWREMVEGWLVPIYSSQTPEEERIAAKFAALEMLRSGTTCFLEAGTVGNLDAVMDGLRETGIRGRLGRWTMDRTTDPDADQSALTDNAIRGLEDELARYPAEGDPRLAAWPELVGHTWITDELWRAAKSLADAKGVGVSAHMSPAEADPAWYLETTGRRPIEHLAELGVLGDNLALTHVVHTDDHEVTLLAESGTTVTFCPTASTKGAYGASRLGKHPEMAARGINIMVGTDGTNNGNSADFMRALFSIGAVFRDGRHDASLFPAQEVLTMGTLNGARGLGLADRIGSLEVGKKADLVLHDTDRIEWRPLFNVINQLIWSADGRGVHSVWVDGRRVVDNYRCTTIDEESLLVEVQAAGEALAARTGLPLVMPWPVR